MDSSNTCCNQFGPVQISSHIQRLQNNEPVTSEIFFNANSKNKIQGCTNPTENFINFRSSEGTATYNSIHLFGKQYLSQFYFIVPNATQNPSQSENLENAQLVLSKNLQNNPSGASIDENDQRAFKHEYVSQKDVWCLKHCLSGKFVSIAKNNNILLRDDPSTALAVDIIQQSDF